MPSLSTPVELQSAFVTDFLCNIGLPRVSVRSASTTSVSRPHRAFTCVTACIFAGSPSDPFHRRLRRIRCLLRRFDCYWLERPLPNGNCTRCKSSPLTAHIKDSRPCGSLVTSTPSAACTSGPENANADAPDAASLGPPPQPADVPNTDRRHDGAAADADDGGGRRNQADLQRGTQGGAGQRIPLPGRLGGRGRLIRTTRAAGRKKTLPGSMAA